MRSAAAYTNKVRIDAITSNNKVEYPGRLATNIQPLNPSCPTTPNFAVLNYVGVPIGCNTKKKKGCLEISNP